MAILEWDGSLAIGHDMIDAQHKILVGLINNLHASQATEREQKEIRRTLRELYDYTVYHFGEEEALMVQLPFAARHNHKLEHDKFIGDLNSITAKANTGEAHIGAETFNWLISWLLDHISVTDRQLIAALSHK